MDEPTSALAETEIRNLFAIMRDLKGRGISVVFITHKLNEVLQICDRVICLKDGENSGQADALSVREDDLVSMMVGRKLDLTRRHRKGKCSDEVVLEVENLSGPPLIADVSFRIRRGEVVALAGLIGAGRASARPVDSQGLQTQLAAPLLPAPFFIQLQIAAPCGGACSRFPVA